MIELTITTDAMDKETLNAYLKLSLPDADDTDILHVTEQIMMRNEHSDRDMEYYAKFGDSVVRCKILKHSKIAPKEPESILSTIKRWLSSFLDVVIKK